MAHNATNMIRTADRTAVHTAVINTGIATGCSHNSTSMTIGIATATAGTLDNHVLDNSILSIRNERIGNAEAILNLSFDGTLEGACLGTDRT